MLKSIFVFLGIKGTNLGSGFPKVAVTLAFETCLDSLTLD
jgi:hypothetical protein